MRNGNEMGKTVLGVLKNANTLKVPKQREEVINLIKISGYPVFEKILDFQGKFGGMDLRVGMHSGLYLSICEYYKDNSSQTKIIAQLNEVYESEGKYYFECGEYHGSSPVEILIDKDGLIYHYEYGLKNPIYKIAESVEELICNLAQK